MVFKNPFITKRPVTFAKAKSKVKQNWEDLKHELPLQVRLIQALAVGTLVTTVGAIGFGLANLDSVPFTGRKRWNPIPMYAEKAIWETPTTDLGEIVGDEEEWVQFIRMVGNKLLHDSPYKQMYDWEFFLVKSDMINAFAQPGGKVFVCSGILDLLKDEQGGYEERLAALLGHEIGHCIARHQTERISLSGIVLTLSYFISLPKIFRDSFTNFVVLLPFSRMHELEADIIGMHLMAEACYNPEAATHFEKELGKAAPSGPKYISTHPPSEERVQILEENLDKAIQRYKSTKCFKEVPEKKDFFSRFWRFWK